MITSALIHRILHFVHFTLHVREICVFLAPLFSSFTVLITYALTKELKVCLHLYFSTKILFFALYH